MEGIFLSHFATEREKIYFIAIAEQCLTIIYVMRFSAVTGAVGSELGNENYVFVIIEVDFYWFYIVIVIIYDFLSFFSLFFLLLNKKSIEHKENSSCHKEIYLFFCY